MQPFSLKRTRDFFYFDLRSRQGELLLPLLLPTAIYTLSETGSLLTGSAAGSWGQTSFIIALLLGLGAAVNAHRKEIDTGTASFHLLLPVTHGERFLSRMAMTLGVCFAGQLLVLMILANLFAAISSFMGFSSMQFVKPSGNFLLISLSLFLPLHSLYFAGGVFFRRSPFIKSTLFALAYAAALGLFMLVLILGGLAQKADFSLEQMMKMVMTTDSVAYGFEASMWCSRIAWQLVAPLLLYAAAYHRSCENEVRG